MTDELRVPALEITQGPKRRLYSFVVDGKQLPLFTTISRVHRDEGATLHGYQRPEVLSHISAIRRYLESDDPLLPNAIVIAFDQRVRFEPNLAADLAVDYARPGTLVIPFSTEEDDADKPGWIVDGQQRTAAIREAQLEQFPIAVTGFIAEDEGEQRTQFILVNSTKPLPKGLIYELLPATDGVLPKQLEFRRFPAYLLDRLNYDEDSPLYHLINTPTTPVAAGGVIKDNSVLKMIENSISDGALYHFRTSGESDAEAMLSLLKDYWSAVKIVFDDAWALPPRRSRLMHGVGIISLGFVMDTIAERMMPDEVPAFDDFVHDLGLLKPVCHWSTGFWNFGDQERRWNELQNTPRDIQLLANHLLRQYRALVAQSNPPVKLLRGGLGRL